MLILTSICAMIYYNIKHQTNLNTSLQTLINMSTSLQLGIFGLIKTE